MATQPPAETPPPSTQPAQPDPGPSELPAPTPDVDFPDPMPGTDPGPGTANPIGFAPASGASSSDVGQRAPGDTDDIGGTDRMTAETGGLAGTSR